MGLSDGEDFKKKDEAPPSDDDRISVVFIGEGGSQNGRMAEVLNSAAKDNLPLLILVIDNGRAINTFTPDIAQNSDVYKQGEHYGVPGVLVNGENVEDVVKAGRATIDYVRKNGPAILQVHTYRFNGHSPADPEHERGRKDEKKWARASQDPIKIFEEKMMREGKLTDKELSDAKKKVQVRVKEAVAFADASPMPPVELAKELEFPDKPDTDYNSKAAPAFADAVNARTISDSQMATVQEHIANLRAKSDAGEITIGDAINLAIHEEVRAAPCFPPRYVRVVIPPFSNPFIHHHPFPASRSNQMLRDPTTTMHAEDLQAGSSYDIPKLTQQTYGQTRAADEIIDEGHFIGKALGEVRAALRCDFPSHSFCGRPLLTPRRFRFPPRPPRRA